MIKKSVDIILPAYRGNLNELEESIKKQVEEYNKILNNYQWNIVISINGGGAEQIIELSKKLSKKYKNVKYLYTEIPGKGSGVINGWEKSNADIRVYMDIDLAVNLRCLPELIKKIELGYDVGIGSRYHKYSKVKRSFKRKLISIFYHLFLLKLILNTKYKDAQCGFKAINRKVAEEIVPLVQDKNWFFESELLYIAQRRRMKIVEIPIIWEEGRFSSINLVKVIPEFFIKMIKLRFRRL
jgi:glycosyltransferase involved in cell wall biosynthesis